MKKYALLALIVLGTSTAAWAAPWACVDVPAVVCGDTDVIIKVGTCIPGTFEGCPEVKWCVKGSIIQVDMYLKRIDACHDAKYLCKDINLKKLCPGPYTVIARVYVKDVGPCPFGGINVLTAVGYKCFTAKSCNPCCAPCWPVWPF
ncbi:MAG: hypothetical protein JW993_10325 [Sedimentisphaerales bacterium]|nr:hypothetical protein [Sedimentisphaerales bacterium]